MIPGIRIPAPDAHEARMVLEKVLRPAWDGLSAQERLDLLGDLPAAQAWADRAMEAERARVRKAVDAYLARHDAARIKKGETNAAP